MLYPVEPWVYNARPLASHRPVIDRLLVQTARMPPNNSLQHHNLFMRQSLVRRAFQSFLDARVPRSKTFAKPSWHGLCCRETRGWRGVEDLNPRDFRPMVFKTTALNLSANTANIVFGGRNRTCVAFTRAITELNRVPTAVAA